MEQLGTTKSVFYGAVMIIILMISSCEFGINDTDMSSNLPQNSSTGTKA